MLIHRSSWFLQEHVHLVPESKYKTDDKPHQCRLNTTVAAGVSIRSFNCSEYIRSFRYWNNFHGVRVKLLCRYLDNEKEILNLLANVGPVSVGVVATTWQNYQGGIIQYHCEGILNHAVQIVGYDLTGASRDVKVRLFPCTRTPFYISRRCSLLHCSKLLGIWLWSWWLLVYKVWS